ncbi:unnamed protein product, partial [Porites lobata]
RTEETERRQNSERGSVEPVEETGPPSKSKEQNSSNEVVIAAASLDREELPAVNSQGAEIVTAGDVLMETNEADCWKNADTAKIVKDRPSLSRQHKFTLLKTSNITTRALVKLPMKNWNKATDILKDHQKKEYHITASLR